MNVQPRYHEWGTLLKEFEGLKLTPYKDSGGIWTVGFGSTYNYDAKRKINASDIITEEKAIEWLKIEMTEVVRLANVYIKVQLNWNQSTAICDYIYNRGIGNFLKASFNGNGLDELINTNPYDLRIIEIIQQTGLKDRLGNLLNGLIRRRKSQAWLYKTGALKFNF